MNKTNSGEFIRKYITTHGISLKFIADQTSMNYELLRRSIMSSSRELRADEFLKILNCLGIKMELSKEQEVIPLL